MSHELGDFLRARRNDASLAPERAGAGRRRASGLRREEVAAAAGISVDYYTRLEQGREHQPSDAVLDAIGQVLQLGDDARAHVGRLRGSAVPAARPDPATDTALIARLTAVTDAVSPNPAYVLDRLSTMVAANEAGLALYDGFASLPVAERNTCRYLLTDPRARQTFVDWEDLARGSVMHLRAANADDLQDPEVLDLAAELSARSRRFATWWNAHLVERRRGSVTHLRTPDGTVIARRYEVLHIPDEALRMTLWLPSG